MDGQDRRDIPRQMADNLGASHCQASESSKKSCLVLVSLFDRREEVLMCLATCGRSSWAGWQVDRLGVNGGQN